MTSHAQRLLPTSICRLVEEWGAYKNNTASGPSVLPTKLIRRFQVFKDDLILTRTWKYKRWSGLEPTQNPYFMLTVELTLRTKSRCKPPHLSRNPAYDEWKVRNIRKGKLSEGENGTSESWASVRRRSDGVIISTLLITQLPLGYFYNNWGFTDVRPPLPPHHRPGLDLIRQPW